MYKLIITESYQRRAKKFFAKHPEILKQYEKILKILCVNPQHPSLRLHKLSGKLAGLSSVSINISYRLIIHLVIRDEQIIPIDVGSHDEVY
ncbi:type II toxin-antitoxin system mRNA interferase toxin, RelE/StbE family [Candidatus Peregrinibacteria bacterium]|nr:type II toxin-antitoxin system mRNA interferase toxin, RelE/StbE family [Candidatus Peregrinibacteria bacterium]